MDVDDNPQTAAQLGVRAVPNLILFKGGAVYEQILGAVPRTRLIQAIDRLLAS